MKYMQTLVLWPVLVCWYGSFYATENVFHVSNTPSWQSNSHARDPFVSNPREGAGARRLRAQKEEASRQDYERSAQEKAEEKARAPQSFDFIEVPLLAPYFEIVEANSAEYKELQNVCEQYQFGDAKRYECRLVAIKAVKEHEKYTHVSYDMRDDVGDFINAEKLSCVDYRYCHGNQLQQVIHAECIEILTQTVALQDTSIIYDYKKVLAECSNSAVHYNKAGVVHKALTVADFCWALLDYGKAIGQGIADGVIGAIHDITEHPLEAALCIVAGEYVLAYQLSKVAFEVAEIGLIACADPVAGSARWQDYIAPVKNIITVIGKKEIAVRDAIKGATQFVMQWTAQAYLLRGLGNFYQTIEKNAVTFAQQYPEILPEAYMAMPEGLLFEVVDESIHKLTRSTVQLAKESPSEIVKRASMKGLIKKHKLPTRGKIRYIPPKKCHISEGLPRQAVEGGKKGFLDRFGNVWKKGESRTDGQHFEWDVQLSKQGQQQLGWMSRDGKHINVSLDGRITHK
jgi:hypothetical protein